MNGDDVKAWQIIVAVIALVVTTVSVTFAATAGSAIKNQNELETRVRVVESTTITNATVLKLMTDRLDSIDRKLDKILGLDR